MSGSTYGYDDGGAIPDDYVPSQDDTTPPAAAPQQDQQPSASMVDLSFPQGERGSWTGLVQETPGQFGQDVAGQIGQDIGQGIENLKNNPVAKRFIGYLTSDAASPEIAKKFVAGAKHEHPELNDSEANLVAVHKAQEQGGDEAGWAMLQYNRTAYNAKQAFAAAALNGTDGKPADPQAAAQAATQASQHMLDGSSASFTANNGGFTATVKMPGTDKQVSYNLTPQQFSQYLNIGGEGQWDKVYANGGVAGALQKLTTQSAQPGTSAQDAGAQTAQEDKGTQAPPAGGGAPDALERTGLGYDKPKQSPYDDDLMQMADKQFPWISQQQQKARWLAAQQEQRNSAEAANQSKEKVATIGANSRIQIGAGHDTSRVEASKNAEIARLGWAQSIKEGKVEAAKLQAQRYAQATQQKIQLALANMQQRAQNAQMQQRLRLLQIKTNDPNLFLRKSPDEVDQTARQMGLGDLLDNGAGAPVQTSAPTQVQAPQPSAPVQRPDVSGIAPKAPPAAVQALKAHPEMRDQFDAKYGQGSAASVLGQ